MTKIRFTLLLTSPPGMPGVSKNQEDQTEVHFVELER